MIKFNFTKQTQQKLDIAKTTTNKEKTPKRTYTSKDIEVPKTPSLTRPSTIVLASLKIC